MGGSFIVRQLFSRQFFKIGFFLGALSGKLWSKLHAPNCEKDTLMKIKKPGDFI